MHSDLAVHRCHAIKGWKIAGILSVGFNTDDTKVAVAKEDGHIDVLHFPTMAQSLTIHVSLQDPDVDSKRKTIDGNLFHIRSIVWRDTESFFTGGLDGVVRVWNAISGKLIESFASGGGPIWSMAIHPDGRLAVATESGHVRIYNKKYKMISVLRGSVGRRMLAVCWTVSSTGVKSTSVDIWGSTDDGFIYGWNIKGKSLAETLSSVHMKFIEKKKMAWSLAYSDAHGIPQLLSADSRGVLTVWDANTRTKFQEISRHEHGTDITCVVVDQKQTVAFTAGVDGDIFMFYKEETGTWDFNGSRKGVHSHDIWALAISQTRTSSGYYVLSGGADCCLMRTTQHSYKGAFVPFGGPLASLKNYPMPAKAPTSVAIRQLERLLLVEEQRGRQLALYKLAGPPSRDNEREEPQLLMVLGPNLEKEVITSALSPEANFMACSDGKRTKVWRLEIPENKNRVNTFPLHINPNRKKAGEKRKKNDLESSFSVPGATCLNLSRNFLVLATHDSLVHVFSLPELKHVRTFQEHTIENGQPIANPPAITSLKISEDGNWLVSGDTNSIFHTYNLSGRQGTEKKEEKGAEESEEGRKKRKRGSIGAAEIVNTPTNEIVKDSGVRYDHKIPEFESPVTLVEFIPGKENFGVLAIVLASNEVWIYEVRNKRFKKDWAQTAPVISKYVNENAKCGRIVGISAQSDAMIVFYTNEVMFTLNMKSRKVASQDTFSLIFSLFFLSKKELVVMEMPWKEFYHVLPEVAFKAKFAH